jgi:HK97 family phage major capsid protein
MAININGKTTKQLREERANLVVNAQKFHAENESTWDDQKDAQFKAMVSDASEYKAAIDRREQLSSLQSEVTGQRLADDPMERPNRKAKDENATVFMRRGSDRQGNPVYVEEKAGPRGSRAYNDAFARYLSVGERNLTPEERAALQSDDNEQAGYLLASEQLAAGILKEVDDEVFVRRYAKVHTVPEATSLGIRRRTARMSSFAFGQELQVATADSALKYGKKVLNPHHLTGQILVSRDLARRASVLMAEINYEMGRNAGEVMEDKYFTGTGAQEPLGVFTASTDGISTGRDSVTGSSTSITADGLINAKYALKAAYRNRTGVGAPRWLFHRDAIKIIAKLKDTTNQYLWQPGLQEGQPDRLLNMPIDESERAPATFTTGLYVGLLACWQYYEIADALDMEMQVLYELYAQTNQIAYVGRLKTDGMPTLEEAFVRLKCD